MAGTVSGVVLKAAGKPRSQRTGVTKAHQPIVNALFGIDHQAANRAAAPAGGVNLSIEYVLFDGVRRSKKTFPAFSIWFKTSSNVFF